MSRLNVNPTRMELTKLKKRLSVAVRGYKLLKDKQDELIRKFIILVKYNSDLRKKVENKLSDSFKYFVISRGILGNEFLDEAIVYSSNKVELDIVVKNIMSVNVPVLKFDNVFNHLDSIRYGLFNTNSELDRSIINLRFVFSELLELAEVEKSTQLLANEIEKTRRRVNALEYKTIPDLKETIKYIRMKLDENERGALIRLMKVKDIINDR
ncbi:V-type ATP synthase subunit D [Candidatus Arthromitus sp. SFB-rat-Yit]|uniref:V-type ATP synthase subunit D n=1 Tax=Candidatus Arthromitus sp. SFB-rat-Yit TaxID=1041504 RepID=UPI000227A2E5|nr:V-type ATP synthase subunit D [Candidatus Arthromitus sp. SFB-rat-Yit]BAK80817.1 V-type sodium ATP synthase subunit D [Candidatus Arthromitus sp. SFB-rat-Yit]